MFLLDMADIGHSCNTNLTYMCDLWFIVGSTTSSLKCTDWEHKEVPEGSKFKARLDPCETCICEAGHPVSCYSTGCAAPPDCKDSILEEVEGECCRFNCIKPADLPPDYKKKKNQTIIINSQNPPTCKS